MVACRCAGSRVGADGETMPMKSEWQKRRARRTSDRASRGRLPAVRLRLRGKRIDPFAHWSSCSGLLEALVDTLVERPATSPCDEALASMISGLLEATGCAVLAFEACDVRASLVTASGTWESRDLHEDLQDAGLEWAQALSDEPMLASSGRRGIGLRVPHAYGRSTATAVAFPIFCGGERIAALLVTYDVRRSYGSSFFAASKLLVGAVGLHLSNGRLAVAFRKQGERVSRLRSDVERMAVLLRRGSDAPPSGSGGLRVS